MDASDSSTITGNSDCLGGQEWKQYHLNQFQRTASGTRNLNGKNVLDFDGTKTLRYKTIGLGTGGTAIQVVRLISDAYSTNHAYGYSSAIHGGSIFLSMNGLGNKFTGQHWDGYTRFEGHLYNGRAMSLVIS